MIFSVHELLGSIPALEAKLLEAGNLSFLLVTSFQVPSTISGL